MARVVAKYTKCYHKSGKILAVLAVQAYTSFSLVAGVPTRYSVYSSPGSIYPFVPLSAMRIAGLPARTDQKRVREGGSGTGPVIMAPPVGSWRAVAIAMVAAAALVTPLATRMAEKWLAVGSPPASPGRKDTVAVVLGYALGDGTRA